MPLIPLIFFGGLAASFALALELLVFPFSAPFTSLTSFTPWTIGTLAILAGIEEFAKYLFLRQYVRQYCPTLPLSWPHAITLGLVFGASFAALEIGLVFFVASFRAPGWTLLGILGLHIASSLVLAHLYRTAVPRRSLIQGMIGLAIFLHFTYNVLVILFS